MGLAFSTNELTWLTQHTVTETRSQTALSPSKDELDRFLPSLQAWGKDITIHNVLSRKSASSTCQAQYWHVENPKAVPSLQCHISTLQHMGQGWGREVAAA